MSIDKIPALTISAIYAAAFKLRATIAATKRSKLNSKPSSLITEGMPVLDYRNGASAVEWVKVLDKILELDFDTVIPGHGKLLTKEHIRSDRQKLATMNDNPTLAIAAYNAGETAVRQWMERTPAEDADLFIESIPYRETREVYAELPSDWRPWATPTPGPQDQLRDANSATGKALGASKKNVVVLDRQHGKPRPSEEAVDTTVRCAPRA